MNNVLILFINIVRKQSLYTWLACIPFGVILGVLIANLWQAIIVGIVEQVSPARTAIVWSEVKEFNINHQELVEFNPQKYSIHGLKSEFYFSLSKMNNQDYQKFLMSLTDNKWSKYDKDHYEKHIGREKLILTINDEDKLFKIRIYFE